MGTAVGADVGTAVGADVGAAVSVVVPALQQHRAGPGAKTW